MSHDIIMTNLTVDVSGAYTSVYKKSVEENVKYKVYTVFIRGVLFFFLPFFLKTLYFYPVTRISVELAKCRTLHRFAFSTDNVL